MSDLVLFSKEWEAKTRELFLPGMPDAEVAVFMEICKLRNLNPFTKQVHFLPFWDAKAGKNKFAMVVSIDGFRSLAARSGLYGGQDEPIFTYDKNGLLVSCKIAVYRKDFERPTVAVAHLVEYQRTVKDRQTGQMVVNDTWKRSPHIMLAKCAEALALRKAFPDDLGGLHEESELGTIVDSELSKPEELQAPVKSRAEAMAKKFAPKPAPVTVDHSESQVSQMQTKTVQMQTESEPPPPIDDDAPPPEDGPTIESYATKVMQSLGGKVESSRAEGDYVISFGKYSGKKLSEVDTGWVTWWSKNSKKPEEREIANAELQRRGV